MEQKLTVGDVVNGTLSTLSENSRPVILFLAIFTLLGTIVEWGLYNLGPNLAESVGAPQFILDWLGLSAGIAGIVLFIAVIVGQYFLWQAMLRQYDYLAGEPRQRVLAFLGLGIVIALGTGLGFVFLIIPGLICMARWAAAPAYLIAEGQGVFEAAGKSWEDLRGNTTPVVLAIVAGAIIFYIIVGGATAIAASSDTLFVEGASLSVVTVALMQFASHLATVLTVGLGVWIFARVRGPSKELTGVFA